MTEQILRPVASHEPEPIIVEIEGVGELEFPGDTDPSVIQAKVRELTTPPAAQPVSTGGGRGTGLDVRKSNQWAKDNAPAIGATLAVAAGPAGLIPAVAMAAGGGYGGARLRGDDHDTAVTSGAIQGGLEAGTRGASKMIGAVAPPLYRAAIPKAIQDKFSGANLAKQGLDSRVVLGTERGTGTARAASAAANQQVKSTAQLAPTLTAQDIQKAFGPKYNKALLAGKNDRAQEIGEHVAQSMREIGPNPMGGPAQLARKEFLEQEGKSAMTVPNANMAAVNPQLANIERKAIVKNLRSRPEMAHALDTSQAAIGVERAARATENSSLVNRLSHGGAWNAGRSPAVFSGTAIGINELANIPWAQLIRMAQIAQLQDEQ